MLEYLKNEANMTYTENGAVTLRGTGSACVDLFGTIGALRQSSEEEITRRFVRAFSEDRDTAVKMLFFARDIRGGLGEKRVFRILWQWLARNAPETVRKNLPYVAEYGRWDDMLTLFDTQCEADMLACVKAQFETDMQALKTGEAVSLLGKWLPSVNASNRLTVVRGKKMAKAFGLNDAAYRKAVTALRAGIHILENDLREKDYSFDYSKQPSRAMFKYRKAFWRNDQERYQAFLEAVNRGEATLHADNVAPYELVEKYMGRWGLNSMSPEEEATFNATWASLPDYGGDEDMLAVIDGSGSMWGTPFSVALSLGLYFAERNKGRFANHFITFSHNPRLIELKGETFVDKLRYAASFNECANTDIEAVYNLVLNAAVKNQLPQSEMPGKLVIISDMEFDCCAENASATNFEHAKQKYASYGYRLPEIVFWNVASRNEQQPVRANEDGVALVSGATPRLFSMVAGGLANPYEFMMEILGSERYAAIAA